MIIEVDSTRWTCLDDDDDIQQCLKVKTAASDSWIIYEGHIGNFMREAGYYYTLRVNEIDGIYYLLEVVEKEEIE